MFNLTPSARRLRSSLIPASALVLGVALPLTTAPAFSQDSERPVVSKKKPPTTGSTVNLVNILVKKGILKEDQAADIIKQAEDEAYISREAARDATSKADEAAKTATAAAAAASPPGSKRVTYVPEIVKRQLREELRKEVMAQAKDEGWASPGKYPEWASRIRFSGDLRGRWENVMYPNGGYNSQGLIYDFNALNTGSPYDISGISNPFFNPPLVNTTQNRERARLRARLGMDADLFEGFTAGLRIATGSDTSPISTNQTMGANGGNFSKYAIWLDRAFIKYEPFKSPWGWGAAEPSSVSILAGRFDNPFWSPTDLVWHRDLGFDGLAVQARQEIAPGFTPFVAAGAFPIFNTSFDFASIEPVKFKSEDRYLYGGQFGFAWKVDPMIGITLAAAMFDFSNVKGQLSSPCDLQMQKDCDTDSRRPSFAQKGNTYTYLRDIVPNAANNYGTTNQLQYFGLAGDYRPAVFSGRLDFSHFDPVHIALDGDFVWNTAFNRDTMERLGINNRAKDVVPNVVPGAYDGGNTGWMTRLFVGNTKLEQFGDWNAHVGYKYLESDATVDAFVDSDFGLGGTNLKGYFLGGNFALAKNVWMTGRWMSATAIAGPPYAVDIFQFDFNAKF